MGYEASEAINCQPIRELPSIPVCIPNLLDAPSAALLYWPQRYAGTRKNSPGHVGHSNYRPQSGTGRARGTRRLTFISFSSIMATSRARGWWLFTLASR